MNRTSSHAVFGFTRRRFFATTVGAMVASVLPVKAVVHHTITIENTKPEDVEDLQLHQCPWCQWENPILEPWEPGDGTDLEGNPLPHHFYVCLSCERRFWFSWFHGEALEMPHKQCKSKTKSWTLSSGQVVKPACHSKPHWHPPGRPYMTYWI